MKTKLLALIAPFALFPLSLFSLEEITTESSIESVSIFKDGALITRTASISVPAGKSTITLDSLPSTAQQDALQASLTNSESGVIRNATLYIPQNPEEPQKITALRDEIQTLRLKITDENKLKETAAQELSFAKKVSTSFSNKYGEINEGQSLTIQQAKDTWSYTQSTIEKSNIAIKESDSRIEGLNKEIKDLNETLNKELETYSQLRSQAKIEVEFSKATDTEITVSYIVTNAHWQPRYELRATPAEKLLEFGYFASIHQFTGEDWSGVELSLYTNQVNRRGNVPELYPLVVNKYEPRPKYLNKTSYKRVVSEPEVLAFDDALEYSAGVNMSAQEENRVKSEIAVSNSAVSFQITLPGKPSIPSARDAKTLPVINQSFTASYWSEVVPRSQLDAYLIGETTNELEIPILAGPALAFVDGKLSSKVFLNKTLPQEELKLSLGSDGNIVVKRREGSSKDSSTGFIDKTTTLKREYFNTVSNFHRGTHDVVIIDQFPLSRNSKIEIKRILPQDSSIEPIEEREGVFQWKDSIPAQGEKTFTTSFEIIYPRDWEIAPKL